MDELRNVCQQLLTLSAASQQEFPDLSSIFRPLF